MKALSSTAIARISCAYFFFINGLAYGSIVARMPALKEQAGLNAVQLGQVIFCLGIGGLVAFPIAGILQRRLSSKVLVALGAIMLLIAWPIAGFASVWWHLSTIFFLFGFANGILEVGGGVQAVMVEKALSRPVMSAFFALFSVGGLIGALLASVLAHWTLVSHYTLLAVLSLLILPFAIWPLLPDTPNEGNEEETRSLRFPPLPILGLALLALCAMVSEGSVADWGALLMKAAHQVDDRIAALAYAGFSATMIIGRLFGDKLRENYALVPLIRTLAIIATLGISIAVFAPHPYLAIFGFALMGIGLSVIAPAMFSAAGSYPGVDPGIGIASISTTGYGGLLLGPAIIGFLAQASSIPTAMWLIIILCAAIIFFSYILKKIPSEQSSTIQ